MARSNPIGEMLQVIAKITSDRPEELARDYDLSTPEGIRVAVEDIYDGIQAVAALIKNLVLMLFFVRVLERESLREVIQVVDMLSHEKPHDIAARYPLSSEASVREAIGDLYDQLHATAALLREVALVMVTAHPLDPAEPNHDEHPS